MIDIGDESTRAGARALLIEARHARGGMPVLRAARPLGVAVASDAHAMLRRDALDEDVDIIDEVNALRERLAEAALASHARWCVCLMHMSGGAAKTRDSSQEQ